MADIDTLRAVAAKLNEQARYYHTVILMREEWTLLSSLLDENERLRAEVELARVDGIEEAAGLAIPAFAYDDPAVFTGIERYREQIELKANKARAALSAHP